MRLPDELLHHRALLHGVSVFQTVQLGYDIANSSMRRTGERFEWRVVYVGDIIP